MFVFFATFGSGHPGYPGYLRVEVEASDEGQAELIARKRINEATGGRWCGLYSSLEKMHPGDRIFRGEA
jgi:hypothetical protein